MSDAPRAPGLGHEHTDITARPIVLAGIGLAIAVTVVAVLMLGLFDVFAAREARLSPPPNPLAAAEGPRVPPEPRLQVHPVKDLRELRGGRFSALRLADKNAGIVRI
jgi:hypothetical protein